MTLFLCSAMEEDIVSNWMQTCLAVFFRNTCYNIEIREMILQTMYHSPHSPVLNRNCHFFFHVASWQRVILLSKNSLNVFESMASTLWWPCSSPGKCRHGLHWKAGVRLMVVGSSQLCVHLVLISDPWLSMSVGCCYQGGSPGKAWTIAFSLEL